MEVEMKVSRDVIYDLLPAYFAGEASADSQALIQEYFETDPEFRRMAERFHAMLDSRTRGAAQTDAVREREAFDRVRLRAKRQQQTRAMAIAFAFAALFGFFMAFVTGWRHPHPAGLILGVAFGVFAAGTFITSYFVDETSRWDWTDM